MRSLVHALSERIRPAATIRLGNRAVRVLRSGSAWRIERSLGGPIESDGVVVALPSYRAAELVREVDATLALELEAIPYASTAVVVTGHALADVRHPLDAFGLVVPHIERRRVLAISFASRKLEERAPTGSVQLRTFVGGALQPELFDLSDARIEGIVERELRELLGVEGPPDFIRVLRHARAMPQYLVGHLDLLAKVDRAVAALPGLALAGNAYRGVGIPDCVHSGEAAAEAVFRVISASSRERAILSL
jgi:oxygen-dependent protoporphyrinogen oxidase